MKKCVFVLEDNQDFRELFTLMLELEDYQVKSYPTAADFYESIQNEHLDVLLLDVMLPDGNGLDICQQLKADPKTSNIPIIMMSAHKELANLKVGCKAEDYIEKPFDIHQFLAKIERLA
ncbi:response regulator [Pedobacter frigidisoli]|uniref:Response regulator n=1 Tax=Pedobacter frigidisoli TaxID=2530455 RepID=A0A4R0NHY3_9SPHI|nr:response regulator [Pedobacter frigidisoli]TCD00250.1 response regulator [Pedobacter frigidisoli]